VKCYIISAGLWLDYLHTSLFIPIYHTAVGIISPVEFAKESSNFQYKLWENHDLTVQPVITYMYSCGWNYGSCLFFFSNHHSVMNQTELKCKIGFRTYINIICILSYTDSWCLVPFYMNIPSNSPHRMCLCFDFRNTLILVYGSLTDTVLCRGLVGGG